MNEHTETGMFNTMSVVHAILSADGSDPFNSSQLRSYFRFQTSSSELLAVPKMIESVVLTEGDAFLQRYNKTYHLRYPFLAMDSLATTLTQCKSDGNLGHIANTSPSERFQIFCVLAIGFAIEGHQLSFAGQIEGNLFILALSHLEEVFKHSQSWDQVRVLLLMTLYSIIRPSVGCTWHLIGLAVRISIGRECQGPPLPADSADPNDIDRVFWCAYMLEQTVCRSLLRTSSLDDHELPYEVRRSSVNH